MDRDSTHTDDNHVKLEHPGHDETYYKGDRYIREFHSQDKRAFTKALKAHDQQVLKAKWTIVRPDYPHEATVILLHERHDFPQRLAERLFRSDLGIELRRRYPRVRWVFPKAIPCTMRFGRPPMWFTSGETSWEDEELENHAKHLSSIVYQEASLLSFDYSRIYLGGIEQGAAMALFALLTTCPRLGGFIGVGGWMPARHLLEQSLELRRRIRLQKLTTPVILANNVADPAVSVEKADEMRRWLHWLSVEIFSFEMDSNEPYNGRVHTPVSFIVHKERFVVAKIFETDILAALSSVHRAGILEYAEEEIRKEQDLMRKRGLIESRRVAQLAQRQAAQDAVLRSSEPSAESDGSEAHQEAANALVNFSRGRVPDKIAGSWRNSFVDSIRSFRKRSREGSASLMQDSSTDTLRYALRPRRN